MSVKFSLLHATFGRPKKAVDAMLLALKNARHHENVEHIFACNDDDDTMNLLEVKLCALVCLCHCIRGPFKGSAPAWDAAAKVSTGDILVQMQDDLELPRWWDMMLIGALQNVAPDWQTRPVVIAVRDGYRKDDLLCTAICNRRRYEQQGEFLHAGYQSVFSDDEFTIRAKADDAAQKCCLIKTDIVFTHRHHYHDPSVPNDATYARENSEAAYAAGQKLFMERNSDLVARGLRTW